MGPSSSEAPTGKILIVDDHQVVLSGTIDILRQNYPTYTLVTAKTAQEALEQLASHSLDLAILDLSIPGEPQEEAKVEHGIELLRQVMRQYPEQNIAIQSTHVKALVRVRSEIDSHQGGFTTVDKSMSSQDLVQRIDGALKGFSYTRDIKAIKSGIELKPEWLDVLTLAFHEGLQDKAIAQQLNVQPSTIRHYWNKLYDVLAIDPEIDKKEGKNLRSLTEIRARERGLLD
ncbi:response regulator [Leptothoe kymatousa]|uniref:Response regulator transcription factor n=1 Tax=Leptothoe kymatousa TAU-MAC 1615 TaxID=2364775 RepID=A0ABS5Y1W6_9CYAN|nr:response regulator transcription factor [Leptothoe kymatousa]MBT9311807.1 response regulator transcription factor [Leptothoe kymatousa TAU-MAC 1615]